MLRNLEYNAKHLDMIGNLAELLQPRTLSSSIASSLARWLARTNHVGALSLQRKECLITGLKEGFYQ